MDKHEHAELLRDAIAARGRGFRQVVADATGRTYRTVGNWISNTNPTLPTREEMAILRELLGDYDRVGDQVVRAIQDSPLHEWRQDRVISEYKRNLREQSLEEVRDA